MYILSDSFTYFLLAVSDTMIIGCQLRHFIYIDCPNLPSLFLNNSLSGINLTHSVHFSVMYSTWNHGISIDYKNLFTLSSRSYHKHFPTTRLRPSCLLCIVPSHSVLYASQHAECLTNCMNIVHQLFSVQQGINLWYIIRISSGVHSRVFLWVAVIAQLLQKIPNFMFPVGS